MCALRPAPPKQGAEPLGQPVPAEPVKEKQPVKPLVEGFDDLQLKKAIEVLIPRISSAVK